MNKNSGFCLFFVFMCSFCFNSCGLDEYVVIAPPVSQHKSDVTSQTTYSLYEEAYFSFHTSEQGENGDLKSKGYKFLGTDVYYKIYSSWAAMNREINAINSLNSSTNETSAFTRLTESYKYKTLGIEGGVKTAAIIENTGENKLVYIRLSSYQAEDKDTTAPFSARIVIIDNDTSKNVQKVIGVPMRNGNDTSFNFGRKSKNEDRNKIPLLDGSEEDVNTETESSDYSHQWYIALYAVSVAQDATLTRSSSKVEYLGSVMINDSEEDN